MANHLATLSFVVDVALGAYVTHVFPRYYRVGVVLGAVAFALVDSHLPGRRDRASPRVDTDRREAGLSSRAIAIRPSVGPFFYGANAYLGRAGVAMIPPVVRRCPACGHVGRTPRFTIVARGEKQLVECPSCHHRFEPIDDPRLA